MLAPTGAATTSATAVLAAIASSPTADADHDGIANADDACPLAPDANHKGCPENHRVDLKAGRIELLKPIHFDEHEAGIEARSVDIIHEIAATLRANPNMRVAITVHVAAQGDPAANLALTKKRAASVRNSFVQAGVTLERVKAYGCGDAHPIAPNIVPWGRKKNERVEIQVLDPAPASGVPSFDGCAVTQ